MEKKKKSPSNSKRFYNFLLPPVNIKICVNIFLVHCCVGLPLLRKHFPKRIKAVVRVTESCRVYTALNRREGEQPCMPMSEQGAGVGGAHLDWAALEHRAFEVIRKT